MVNEKGLDPAAADRIGEFVQLSGGVELADKLTLGKFSLNKSHLTTWSLEQYILEHAPDSPDGHGFNLMA